MESKQQQKIVQPSPELAASLDVERLRIGGLDALADAMGLNPQTVARLILREPCWHGSVALARAYFAKGVVR